MQAIQTKYIPATNYKGSRVKAWCARGSITISYPHDLSGDDVHVAAAQALVVKFAAEDVKKYGKPDAGANWLKPRSCGQLKSGDYVHVFMPTQPRDEKGCLAATEAIFHHQPGAAKRDESTYQEAKSYLAGQTPKCSCGPVQVQGGAK